ncbi:hypothetical protein OMW55_04565 [Sphingomonas sp. BN140010]|uniref:Tetratricopeptide repeat protein n=1 Tax=Sphingomonas arvum TaxID=2992113 RepID=A0ABT3JDC0_9SPHN|nr:hypothetical protein [Sphingomonas sp. BN140010]MCW3797078.1 hypothetical protein [Sphingomonas sp. BN140010]
MIRRAGLVVATLAAAVLAIREATVDAFSEQRPELAAKLWANHPKVVAARGMAAIGAAAAVGKPPPPAVTTAIRSIIRRDPLNAAPLLVAGTEAFATGQVGRAERLLLASGERDPFAPAPRFLLTDLYLRQGRASEGMRQLDYLLRRVGPNATALLPSLVRFAHLPGGADQLRPLVAGQPELREPLLELLAADPVNLPAILALAGPRKRGAAPQWQATLLASMVERQDYQSAHRLWLRLGGTEAGGESRLFNPHFLPGGPPPPFNWRLGSGSGGVAEAQPGGGLHLLYYGRENMVLAEQLLLLAPGKYRLRQEWAGEVANLSWALVCLPAGTTQQGAAEAEPRFTVTAGCAAQRLELRGTVADSSSTTDAIIRQVRLVRENGR